MFLSKDQISQADDAKYADVAMPEWGGDVRVRSMSVKDRVAWEKKQADGQSQTEMMVSLVLYTCVDDAGQRIFSDDDAAMLENKSPASLIKLFNAAIDLNVLNNDKLEEQAKNS